MLVLYMLVAIKAYYLGSPRHTLMITARASPTHLDPFPFAQFGPYKSAMEPIIISRTFRTETEGPLESEKEKKSAPDEKSENPGRHLSDAIFGSTICRILFYVVIGALIFFIGYQTGKAHEGGSYVRLPNGN
jgi:hypothetical protein